MNKVGIEFDSLTKEFQQTYKNQDIIMSFSQFLDRLKAHPSRICRTAPEYLLDTFDYFGSEKNSYGEQRFKLFDLGTGRNNPIVGGEKVQKQIYATLKNFVRQNAPTKLILLHGPNGSAKTSTVETIGHAANIYSKSEEGALYTFNWIFPVGKNLAPRALGETGPVGFGASSFNDTDCVSFAHLTEDQIASKIHSEFKENPIYLLPMPYREKFLQGALAKEKGLDPESFSVPYNLLNAGLSKKNQLIFENLLMAYGGDLDKVLRHVQVERIFLSRQYRVGISTIEPQLSLDAREAMLSMDKNIANLPSILHNIRFHEASGQLVEANRGILHFSDLLKRPIEAFKYLLTIIENQTLTLPSSSTNLDLIFIATSNDKHLDGFKTTPDFSSFRERFELITVPYILMPSVEMRIYQDDVKVLSQLTDIVPHSLEMLCTWAVLTRLKQPDPEAFDKESRELVENLKPLDKVKIYDNKPLPDNYSAAHKSRLQKLRNKLMHESDGLQVYEGRFGASPREVRAIFHRSSQHNSILSPMVIFKELRRVVRDRTIYEFLQYEPRGKYHDATAFIKDIEEEFANIFETELLDAMGFVEEVRYTELLQRYIQNVVAFIKKEKIFDSVTESYIPASDKLMTEIEKVINIPGSVDDFRQTLINRLASFKLENKEKELVLSEVFDDILKKIKDHYHVHKKVEVKQLVHAMLASDDASETGRAIAAKVEKTYKNMKSKYGYSEAATKECVKFLLSQETQKS